MEQYDFLRAAIEKQLELSNSNETFHSIITTQKWFYKQSLKKEKYEEFEKWFLNEYKTKFDVKLTEAKEALNTFQINFGFKVEGEEIEIPDSEIGELT